MKTQGNESIVNANNYSEKKCTLHSLTLFKVIYLFPVLSCTIFRECFLSP